VATIRNVNGSKGLATALSTGKTIILARRDLVVGATVLTVTPPATLVAITVTPDHPAVPLGFSRQFTATGVYSDGTTLDLTSSADWTSSNAAVASIGNGVSKGLATSASIGTTTVSAVQGGVTGTTQLDVTAAIMVSLNVVPRNVVIASGGVQQFVAVGTFSDSSTQDITSIVAWTSSDPAVATIDASGLALGIGDGQTTISATLGPISGSTVLFVGEPQLISIAVVPATPTIAAGTTQQFTAVGIFSDGSTVDITTTVTWNSSDPSVATISNAAGTSGLAVGGSAGTTIIFVTLAGVTGTTELTVAPAVLVALDVQPANPTIAVGTTQQFTAVGVFSDGSVTDMTTVVSWESLDPAVATIANAVGTEGLATGLSPGTTGIGAVRDGITGMTTLSVTEPIARD
jgi:uncharacterized protein YjdB